LIVECRIEPGERLKERLLCERLGISRTPLREAIKLLATEGLVRLLPNRGAIVAPLDPGSLAEAFQVIGALEGLAGELACRCASATQIAEIRALHEKMIALHGCGDLAGYFQHNQAIHLKIVEASRNTALTNMYRQLNANVRRARYMANLSEERWEEAVHEHTQILAALEARDVARLKNLLQDHLANKLSAVLRAHGTAA
jgi:DNA-binding GntR family transcriptional regulator